MQIEIRRMTKADLDAVIALGIGILELQDHSEPAFFSRGTLSRWLAEQQSWLDDQLDRHGAVLLRGFGVDSDQDFEGICRTLIGELKRYVEGNSPRQHTSDYVYTSTSYPAEFNMSWNQGHERLPASTDSVNFETFAICPEPGATVLGNAALAALIAVSRRRARRLT